LKSSRPTKVFLKKCIHLTLQLEQKTNAILGKDLFHKREVNLDIFYHVVCSNLAYPQNGKNATFFTKHFAIQFKPFCIQNSFF
jgi:hypothetical protein